MKKILLYLLFLLLPSIAFSSPPSRVYTYADGNTIKASENTSNEDAIFNYLSRGVDTYADSSITTDDILDGTIKNSDISGTAAIVYSKLSLGSSLLSSDIKDGEIVNADINASAEIVDTKLATISTSGKVNGSAVSGAIVATTVTANTFTSDVATGTAPFTVASTTVSTNLNADLLDGISIAALLQYSDTRFKLGSFTRTTEASGDVSYTGVGFQPKVIIFKANGSNNFTDGYDDATTHCYTGVDRVNVVQLSATASIKLIKTDSSTDYQVGFVKTMDSDGFTITWVKTNNGANAGTVYYIAFR